MECELGQGRAIVMVPSFERYVTGAIAPASAAQAQSFRGLLENLLTYVLL